MRLSTRARYGLRAMTAIARHRGTLVTSEIVAGEEGVSKKYLDSILARLREAGFLEAARGARGGYRLARPAGAVTAVEVVEALEGRIAIVPCVEDSSECDRTPRCPTREVWCAASDAVRDVLAALTLAELASREPAVEAAEATHSI
ncbi:MAG: RrF2 family transcriptional regulator [Planctomycetota bacterium]